MQKDAKLDYQRMLEAVKDAKTEAMMLEFVEQEDGKQCCAPQVMMAKPW